MLQLGEVAADGLAGDVELVRQLADVHSTTFVYTLHDPRAALRLL